MGHILENTYKTFMKQLSFGSIFLFFHFYKLLYGKMNQIKFYKNIRTYKLIDRKILNLIMYSFIMITL